MSLKAFHIFFVSVSILLMLGIAGWSYGNYRTDGSSRDLLWSGVAAAGAVVLLVYGRYFLKKLKHISYL